MHLVYKNLEEAHHDLEDDIACLNYKNDLQGPIDITIGDFSITLNDAFIQDLKSVNCLDVVEAASDIILEEARKHFKQDT